MALFPSKGITDQEIWSRLTELAERRDYLHNLLSRPEISTDSEVMPKLARELHKLDPICLLAKELKQHLKDQKELESELAGDGTPEDNALQGLCRENEELCTQTAAALYQLLLDKGYLEEDAEDDTDLAILRFIEYAGPEYAWRLGINIGLEVTEARERIELLLRKGLLERIEGTMLDNYHRQKNWTKHMNHTYYRISRVGRHYLRHLRRSGKI